MKTLLNRIKVISPVLYFFGVAHLALFVILIVVALFDQRQLLGVNLWIKPVKFALSIALYCLTWPLLLQYLPFERLRRRFARFTAFAMSFEMAAIASQAARGQLSHYNNSSHYNLLVFNLMGIVIVSQTLFALYIGIKFFKVKAVQISPAMLWAIRLGIIMACFFALEGGVMAAKMAHTVGAADGSPGLPLFNWSRIAGDLRIAHFMGMHALQMIPLFALINGMKSAKPTIVFALIYFVIVLLLLFNALQGRPLF
ncbi:hypothetical protein KHS38_01210 [Mucilaginibacter sp. Bleaf8]|uniref:hypothetical protein n=1 Tax=Mucilaginibacter sp. Bleaf8 TaxID=2834430 RepID=UPI001BD08788|nr:hypothetical protein [Mucilaginibacter sp. Bleaf8]MBS7563008.1 hypothetical protein [Mucilaginibacter sp. Bleaf8]